MQEFVYDAGNNWILCGSNTHTHAGTDTYQNMNVSRQNNRTSVIQSRIMSGMAYRPKLTQNLELLSFASYLFPFLLFSLFALRHAYFNTIDPQISNINEQTFVFHSHSAVNGTQFKGCMRSRNILATAATEERLKRV